MRKNFTLLKSLFLICLVPSITFAQISSKQIDSLVADALLKFKVAGAAVAVVKDGKVIHSKGYGLVDITLDSRLGIWKLLFEYLRRLFRRSNRR